MKFTIYSKEGCPACQKVQQLVEMCELRHVVYKLGRDFQTHEFKSEFGSTATFPRIVVDDKRLLGGANEFVKYLKDMDLV
tara:strand:+ start:2063 stop:2302 length:240 start_codon:yes stop_codon:yes gene_type:complete